MQKSGHPVYIFDAVRTPRGKGSAKSGALRDLKPVQVLSQLFSALENRTNLDDKDLEGIILGCVGQVGDQGADIAKMATILMALPLILFVLLH